MVPTQKCIFRKPVDYQYEISSHILQHRKEGLYLTYGGMISILFLYSQFPCKSHNRLSKLRMLARLIWIRGLGHLIQHTRIGIQDQKSRKLSTTGRIHPRLPFLPRNIFTADPGICLAIYTQTNAQEALGMTSRVVARSQSASISIT